MKPSGGTSRTTRGATLFGAAHPENGIEPTLTIADAVRRCRWIMVDIHAAEFGLFLVGASLERARLLPSFDSDHPRPSLTTKYLSGSNGEDLVRHARVCSAPVWWSDDRAAPCVEALGKLGWAVRAAPPVPATSGIAFPVFAERGRCGLAVFIGPAIAISAEALSDIHGRCFALFTAVAAMRPAESNRLAAISRRELECLKLTANGYTSEEIAKTLKLSVHTANQYLTSTTQKLNAVNRMQAVAKALRMGLIE